jgi:hypothetical protein
LWHCHIDEATTLCPWPEIARLHAQMIEHSRENKSYTAILPKFAKICTLGVRTWAKTMAPCVRSRLTRPVHASSRTRAQLGTPRAHAGPCLPVHHATSIRAGKPRPYSLCASLNLSSPTLSSDELCAARQATRVLGRRGQTPASHPHSISCLG